MTAILARKLNMTQTFTTEGRVIPVTVLEVPENKVTQIRTTEKDGYQAVQISAGKFRREFPVSETPLQIGQVLTVNDFQVGDVVDVIGISKGRGFAGAMKRHGFHGAPASHGHDHPRAVGSIGQMFPQHVRPGLRMAGHMGAAQATVKNSVVIAVDAEKKLLMVKGGVPGAPHSWLQVRSTGKKQELSSLVDYSPKQAEVINPQSEEVTTPEGAK